MRGKMKRRNKTYHVRSRTTNKGNYQHHHETIKATINKIEKNPQLDLLLRISPHYERSLPLPYELLMKIFHYLVDISDHPIRDLCSLAQVCETWRILIVESPSLWSRIIFEDLPITDGNLRVLYKLIDLKPAIVQKIKEVTLRGPIKLKSSESPTTLKMLISAPNLDRLSLEALDPENRTVLVHIVKAILECRKLKNLTVKNTRYMFDKQKWLADYLIENGKHLEELHLTQSFTSVSTQLFRAISCEYCPHLRVLDLSTCDFLNTRSFDAILLASYVPNLVILRVANVSFRRVHQVPDNFGLNKLEELSMPIGMRDADRDDVLFATLTYGSESITTLDLRGSNISANGLIDMPSYNVRSLHLDDISPITRTIYSRFIRKWRHSLTTLSLVKINCSETIKSCLNALKIDGKALIIREIDLESSDVLAEDLKDFLDSARFLQKINLTSCRSLPRGCKGKYSEDEIGDNCQKMMELKSRIGALHSNSETEIDEGEDCCIIRTKRLRTKVSRPDYVEH